MRWDGLLRRLTFEEVKLLQGFTADWEAKGTKAQRYKQIGNAVPTIFGEQFSNLTISFLQDFPNTPPVFLDLPSSFKKYINYTKRDHEKNKDSRKIHRKFA